MRIRIEVLDNPDQHTVEVLEINGGAERHMGQLGLVGAILECEVPSPQAVVVRPVVGLVDAPVAQ